MRSCATRPQARKWEQTRCSMQGKSLTPAFLSLDVTGEANVQVSVMACLYRAVLLVTRDMKGTSSAIATERLELACGQPAGHEGCHRDVATGIGWNDEGKLVRTLLRNEDEPVKEYYP